MLLPGCSWQKAQLFHMHFIKKKLIEPFLTSLNYLFFFRIHFKMPEVIHGECSLLCVKSFMSYRKVYLQKPFHEINYVFYILIRIWVRREVIENLRQNVLH